MKILIVNQFTCNRGDEAAGRAVIESLLKEFPDVTIDVLYKFIGNYPPIWEDTERVKHFPELKLIRGCEIEIFLNFVLLLLGKKNNFIGLSGKVFEHIQKADIVVNAPTGPNIGDIYKDKAYITNLFIAILFGKKTFMYGSSVGPFKTRWIRKAAKYIFDRMEHVCVRDEISFNYLKQLNLKNKNIHCSLDAAVQRKIDISNASKLYEKAKIPLNKPLVGVTPLAYQWYPIGMKFPLFQNKVENNMIEILNSLIDKNDNNIVFFPQLFHKRNEATPGTTDLPIINSIIEKMKRPERAFIVPQHFDSDYQQSMISKLDFFIGMRYHSIVFSTKMLIPCVGICYEHKSKGFMKKSGIENLSVDLTNFIENPNIVLEKINYIQENKINIKEKLSKILPELELLSKKGTELIFSRVREYNLYSKTS